MLKMNKFIMLTQSINLLKDIFSSKCKESNQDSDGLELVLWDIVCVNIYLMLDIN